jgi:hypothetical protein
MSKMNQHSEPPVGSYEKKQIPKAGAGMWQPARGSCKALLEGWGTHLRALIDCGGVTSGGWGSRGTSAEIAGMTWEPVEVVSGGWGGLPRLRPRCKEEGDCSSGRATRGGFVREATLLKYWGTELRTGYPILFKGKT